jgi:hypothetical protein
MTDKEQITAFAGELDNLVARYEKEFNLSVAGAIGVLHLKIYAIEKAANDNDDEEGTG